MKRWLRVPGSSDVLLKLIRIPKEVVAITGDLFTAHSWLEGAFVEVRFMDKVISEEPFPLMIRSM